MHQVRIMFAFAVSSAILLSCRMQENACGTYYQKQTRLAARQFGYTPDRIEFCDSVGRLNVFHGLGPYEYDLVLVGDTLEAIYDTILPPDFHFHDSFKFKVLSMDARRIQLETNGVVTVFKKKRK